MLPASSARIATGLSLTFAFIVATAGAQTTLTGSGQAYPTKPVRLIVPYPPGGLTDIVARTLAPSLTEALKQQVIVDNRPGGGSTIGTDLAAKAPPDGHTLLAADQALITNPSLYSKLPFDTLKDLQPVTVVGAATLVIVTHPSLPVKTVKELVALAKSKPGAINYASGGNGTATHLAGELFKQVAGVDLVHIPYKGGGIAIIDLVGGQVSLSFASVGSSAPFIAAKRIRALAVTSPARIAALPDTPTLAEVGYPAASVLGYWGVMAPAGVSRDIIERLSSTIVRAVQRPEMRQKLVEQGIDPTASGPADYDRILRSEIPKWGKVIKQAGIKID
jgi:tripartite-type tricarboxylate transporter receptor subunit TctC